MTELVTVWNGTIARNSADHSLCRAIGHSSLHDHYAPQEKKKGGEQYARERQEAQNKPEYVPPTRAEIVHCRCVLGWTTRKISRHFHIKMADVYMIEGPARAQTLDLFGESA